MKKSLFVFVTFFSALLSHGATLYWDPDADTTGNDVTNNVNIGGSGTWDTSSARWFETNTLTDIAWTNSNNDIAFFTGPGGSVTLGAPITAGGIRFGTNAYTISSDTLTLASGATIDTGGGTNSISSTLAAGDLIKTGTGSLALSVPNNISGITVVSNGTLSIDAEDRLGATPGSTVSNAITLTGNATLQLSAPFSLNINRGITLGASGGKLDIVSGDSTYDGLISGGNVGFTKAGAGTLILNGTNLTTGTVTVAGGTLRLGGPARLSTNSTVSVSTNMTLDLNSAAVSLGGLTGPGLVLNENSLTLGANNTAQTFSGFMSGAGSLTKIGTNIQTLSGTNTFTGKVTILAGALAGNNDTRWGAIPGGVVSDYFTLNGGTLRGTGNHTVNANRGITLGTNGGTLESTSGTLTIAGIIEGSNTLTKAGTSTVTLSGDNTITGPVNINAGILSIASHVRLGTGTQPITINGGTLRNSYSGAGFNFVSTTRPIVIGTNNGTLDTSFGTTSNSSILLMPQAISGPGILTKAGQGELRVHTANNTSAKLVIAAGMFCLGHSSGIAGDFSLGAVPTNFVADAVTINNGATNRVAGGANVVVHTNRGFLLPSGIATFRLSDGRTYTIPSVISGAGGFLKFGSANLTVSGANTYSGPTMITGGKVFTTTASTGGGSYSVGDGAGLSVRIATPGTSLNMSSLSNGLTTGEFDLGGLGLPSTRLVNVTGNLVMSNNMTVDVKNFDSITGLVTLLEYAGTRSLTGAFVTGAIPPHVQATFTDDIANKRVLLDISAADTLAWVGGSGDVWNVNNSGNLIWQAVNAAAPTFYQETAVQGDTVRFDDAATTDLINIPGTVLPYKLTISNISRNFTFTGPGKVSGAVTLLKEGIGSLTLQTSNDYTGGTLFNGGALLLGTNGALGTGKLTINGGTPITSDSVTARTSLSPVDLNANVTLGDSVNSGDLTFSTGAWTITGASRQITVDTVNATISSAIGQDGTPRGLTKAGSGTLSLTTGNTFSGGFTHNAGSVRVNANAALGAANSPVTLAGGVTLGVTATTARTLTYAHTLNGNLTLGDPNGGTAAVTLAGTMNLAGGVRTISTASTNVISAVITNGGLAKAGSGTLDLSAANVFTGGVQHNEGTLRVNGVNALGATSNNVVFADGVTFATTTTTARTLTNRYAVNGTLTLGQSSGGTAALTLSGSVDLTGDMRRLIVSNATDTIVAPITNGAITKAGSGTLVLTGTNLYAGGTVVEEGILEGSTVGLQGNITNNAMVSFSQTTTGTYSNIISGTGTLRKIGTGTVTLSGANTYSGTTSVTNGTLLIRGSIASSDVIVTNATLGGTGTIAGPVSFVNGGSLAAGDNAVSNSIGQLSLQNGLNLGAATNRWELAALVDDTNGVAGTDFDQIQLTGGALSTGNSAVLAITFTNAALAPDFATPFWQTSHKWTVVKLTGGASNPGNENFSVVFTNTLYHAGSFYTQVETDGISLNFTPAGPTAPILRTNLVNLTVIQGSNATFTISVAGTAPLTYDWYFQNNPLVSLSSNSLVRTAVTTNEAGSYFVIVTNSFGSLTSATVTLTVLVPPTFLVQPASQTVEAGTNVTFTALATGTAPLAYQWLSNSVLMANQTNTFLTLNSVTTNFQANYSVRVINGGGTNFSTNAVLTVTAPSQPPQITSVGISNNIMTLTWSSIAARTYRPEFVTNLTSTNWISLGNVLATNTVSSATNDVTGAGERFYRIQLLP
jgi:fibronectin-binding autotransporter adhesin